MATKDKKVKIKLKSYDTKLLDNSSIKVIEVARDTGTKIIGPVPLPTRREVFTILRSVHVNKDSREQYELRTHKRLVQLINPSKETMDKLNRLTLPSGVSIDIIV